MKANYKKEWKKLNTRYYDIAGITIKLESDIPFNGKTFNSKFKDFQVDEPGDDIITIHHHFEIPQFKEEMLGDVIYKKPPWKI